MIHCSVIISAPFPADDLTNYVMSLVLFTNIADDELVVLLLFVPIYIGLRISRPKIFNDLIFRY